MVINKIERQKQLEMINISRHTQMSTWTVYIGVYNKEFISFLAHGGNSKILDQIIRRSKNQPFFLFNFLVMSRLLSKLNVK